MKINALAKFYSVRLSNRFSLVCGFVPLLLCGCYCRCAVDFSLEWNVSAAKLEHPIEVCHRYRCINNKLQRACETEELSTNSGLCESVTTTVTTGGGRTLLNG